MSDAKDHVTLRDLTPKEFRDEFMSTMVRGVICYQLQALREQRSMTQAEFALAIGKSQTVVSRLESVERSRATVQTLLDIACALDIALQVRFIDYPSFLTSNRDVSPRALEVAAYSSSQAGTQDTAPNVAVPYSLKMVASETSRIAVVQIGDSDRSQSLALTNAGAYPHITTTQSKVVPLKAA